MSNPPANLKSETAERPGRPPRLVDRIVEQIEQQIRDGNFDSDSKLPSEHEFAAMLSVSRPVVREAIGKLREKGLVYSRQGAGTFLQSKPATSSVLSFAPIQTIADIQRCYEFRLALEADAAYLAAQRVGERSLSRIRKSLNELREATAQRLHRTQSDFDFHRAIADAANNHYYSSSMDALREHIAVAMHFHGLSLVGPQQQLETVYLEHEAIFDALASRDPSGARRSMVNHLEGSRARLFEGRLLDLRAIDEAD